MNINDAFVSRYLKASDISEDLVMTISSVVMENLSDDDKEERKPILYFSGMAKGLVLNKTNAEALVEKQGLHTEDWVGMSVTLYSTFVDFHGRKTAAIRLKNIRTTVQSADNKHTSTAGYPIIPKYPGVNECEQLAAALNDTIDLTDSAAVVDLAGKFVDIYKRARAYGISLGIDMSTVMPKPVKTTSTNLHCVQCIIAILDSCFEHLATEV